MDKTVHPEESKWTPDLDDADVEETVIALVGPHRVFQKLWFLRGQVVDFVLIQQTQGDGGDWDDVVRTDCCHAEVHAHYFRGNQEVRRNVFNPITSQADVTAGLDRAETVIYDKWEENLRGWNG